MGLSIWGKTTKSGLMDTDLATIGYCQFDGFLELRALSLELRVFSEQEGGDLGSTHYKGFNKIITQVLVVLVAKNDREVKAKAAI
jgi:hypothetical protein